jgi:protein-S-isoprenylcysteine O-methyltransferase Ste14
MDDTLPPDDARREHDPVAEIGEKLFQWRDYTPIPLIIVLLFAARPNAASATVGTLIIVFGELIRIYSVAFIGSVSRTRNVATVGGGLITSGPFAVVRNPLYVGNFFICFGIAVFSGKPWLVVLTALLFGLQYYAIVRHEERLLVSRFGRDYEAYMGAVPAWVPASLPALESIEWPASFSPALRSERRTLTAIFAILLVLILLH